MYIYEINFCLAAKYFNLTKYHITCVNNIYFVLLNVFHAACRESIEISASCSCYKRMQRFFSITRLLIQPIACRDIICETFSCSNSFCQFHNYLLSLLQMHNRCSQDSYIAHAFYSYLLQIAILLLLVTNYYVRLVKSRWHEHVTQSSFATFKLFRLFAID